MTTPCAGCCDVEDCPCRKVCEENYCDRHFAEEAAAYARHIGLRPGMTWAERNECLERFRPPGVIDENPKEDM